MQNESEQLWWNCVSSRFFSRYFFSNTYKHLPLINIGLQVCMERKIKLFSSLSDKTEIIQGDFSINGRSYAVCQLDYCIEKITSGLGVTLYCSYLSTHFSLQLTVHWKVVVLKMYHSSKAYWSILCFKLQHSRIFPYLLICL